MYRVIAYVDGFNLYHGPRAPAIHEIRRVGGGKRVIAAFPPRRRSDALRRLADGSFTIGDAKLRQAQLPSRVGRPSGPALRRPAYWA
ncbi:hypothetical protein O7635_04135 [Asanoa sp. WMMD1127]|uniref:hypothetical protein n=1 Tax=Asanoa sp. WMMD1127 TaxID=3016107 RepID=UPI00241728E9|nr:hypothetical protein [Asanoa sp. WMMD1127]MDG4821042.1 hypothetical protein [Asanoa sp. WMMD1127]